jgi:REP element-mobilizing transposase RayT
MPRAPRIFVEGATYHVYARTARAEPVFAAEAEVRELLELVRDLKRRDELTILAWCVLPSCYHLALRSAAVPLWRTMRLLQSRFSTSYNRRRGVHGPLWQDRYRARLVAGGARLDRVIAYIHLSPVVAGVARDPADYPWSGHRELIGEVAEPIADVGAALAVFGEPIADARRSYATALAETAGAPWLERAPGALPWWTGRRSDRGGTPTFSRASAAGASTSPERPRLSAADLVTLAATATGTAGSELRSPRSGARLTRRRELIALVGVELFGVRVNDLARELGRDPSSVSRWITAAGARRADDPAYRRSAEELAALIADAARSQRAVRSGFIFESGPSFSG